MVGDPFFLEDNGFTLEVDTGVTSELASGLTYAILSEGDPWRRSYRVPTPSSLVQDDDAHIFPMCWSFQNASGACSGDEYVAYRKEIGDDHYKEEGHGGDILMSPECI